MVMIENQPASGIEAPGVTDISLTTVPESVFRAYDIRGIAYEELSVESVKLISRAIGSEAQDMGISDLYVGYDGRLSSPDLSAALIMGLRESGCNVVSLGLLPTPLLYFAIHTTDIHSGVMLTASHNPANYNGLKIVFNKTCLADNQIQSIRNRIAEQNLKSGSGSFHELDIKRSYLAAVKERIQLRKPLHVVVDCGNAVPGIVAPELFTALGCTVEPLYCDLDGEFPNHHPDPTVPANLELLSKTVRSLGADLGVAFDGDGDRLGIVTDKGAFIDADRMLLMLATDIAPRYQGEAAVFDVKCSKKLAERLSELGMKPVMHRSGHSFMKQKMEQTKAPLGGEYAAHLFLKDRWFGFDDGMYAAARLIEILAARDETADELFADFDMPEHSTPEIKVPVRESMKFDLIEQIIKQADFDDGQCIYLDGLRVEFENGWGLVRASNTSPALLLRFEADDEASLEQIKSRFKALIHGADKSIELSF